MSILLLSLPLVIGAECALLSDSVCCGCCCWGALLLAPALRGAGVEEGREGARLSRRGTHERGLLVVAAVSVLGLKEAELDETVVRTSWQAACV